MPKGACKWCYRLPEKDIYDLFSDERGLHNGICVSCRKTFDIGEEYGCLNIIEELITKIKKEKLSITELLSYLNDIKKLMKDTSCGELSYE